MSDYTFHEVAIADRIATVTMNRPPVNAQTRETREEMIAIFDALSDDPDVSVVILCSATKAFSAGADIKERTGIAATKGDYVRHNRLAREFFYAVADCEKPVIAAINGPAIGAGFALMLACDIMLASEDAWFQMPEVNVGLAGGAAFIMEHFSKSRCRTMYFTARRYPASELYRLGVIETVTPNDALMETAMSYAREIAAKSPMALQAAKRAFGTVAEMPVRDAYRFEQSLTVGLSRTEDAKEAQRAFVEKRPPVFKRR
ncbi:enoyl-CoA hydratase/isomerase family protein [Loktanella sp. M215]|uniref:enoyl-CoA hydratase/isomerase family protein n=1 Tax=Loktanella sp. M215 TaxID=2675431 RepID=UPI001F23133A|nr:enoyl-CoA hydratase/isomerase family protein [Loktanella sp. M215]MCF7701784.1 enoyl-CoA hydratase/isomerase family protein [Loktanella sp. M215]